MKSKDNFNVFIGECNKYIELFHLNDWDVLYEHCELGKGNAEVSYQSGLRKATIRLATNIQDCVPVGECALHECLELLLADISLYFADFYSDHLVSDEIHRVINKLIPAIKYLECGEKQNKIV